MLHLRPLTVDDLSLGLHLSRQAGWNQLPTDWQRFLDCQPDGGIVAEWQGTPVGTTMTIRFGSVAWIAMVLVEESLRGRGIGKALLIHALEQLEQQGVATVRLDATPLGQPLYERLGFVAQFQLARYEGTLSPTASAAGIVTAAPEQWVRLTDLDQAVTNTDRRRLLQRLFAEQPDTVHCVWHQDCVAGFRAARPGARAVQLGPCIATPEVGPLLFADACNHHAGQRVYVDIPMGNEPACRLAETMGLTVQRHLLRMYRGVPLVEQVEKLWASAGPEKG